MRREEAESLDLILNRIAATPLLTAAQEVELAQRSEVEAVERVLESLDYRERRVLTLRFGIGGERVQSYPEIARQLRVRPGRIREIEEAALRRLRAHSASLPLRELLQAS